MTRACSAESRPRRRRRGGGEDRRARPATPLAALAQACALVGAATIVTACGAGDGVTRVMDGRRVAGRFIEPDAYGTFLLGALADEQGAWRRALADYEATAALDPDEPEVWTRVGRVRCRLSPADPRADAGFARALSLDPTYAPALTARAACEALRKGKGDASAATSVISAQAPHLPAGAPATGATPGSEPAEASPFAVADPDRPSSWAAPIAWGLSSPDSAVCARRLASLARAPGSPRAMLARAAATLLGSGRAIAARHVAAALVDSWEISAPDVLGAAAVAPDLARLAIDEALVSGNPVAARRRAALARVRVEVVAARAWAMGEGSLARALVVDILRSDPANLEARMVFEGATGGARSEAVSAAGSPPEKPGSRGTLPPDVAIPFARDILLAEGAAAARRIAAMAGRLTPDDALLTTIATRLAVAGGLPDGALPANGRIELALRRGVLPSDADMSDAGADARHRLLGMAVSRPADTSTAAAAARLGDAAAEDVLVAVAIARVALAHGEPVPQEAWTRIETASSTDAVAAATLVELTRSRGGHALDVARRRLAALAVTPWELARAAP